MNWQVGRLDDFKADDPEFDDKRAAFDYAEVMSDDFFEDVWGVWTGQDDGSELIAIAYNGELFWRDLADFGVHITLPVVVNGTGSMQVVIVDDDEVQDG